MKLYMTHADTPLRVLYEKTDLQDPALHIHAGALAPYEEAGCVFAFWTSPKLSDAEAWDNYLRMRDTWHTVWDKTPLSCFHMGRSIENGRLVEGDLSRLDTLWEDGIRIFTPMWHGETRLGGSFNTQTGLTPEGVETLTACMALGMQIDVSHSGDHTIQDIFRLCEKHGGTVCATHSNTRHICPHPRNLTDDQIRVIGEMGGWVGICLVQDHIGGDFGEGAILRHIDHLLALGMEDHITFGGDLDGTALLAGGYRHVGDLTMLYDALQTHFGTQVADKIFWQNAQNHLKTVFG